MRSTASVILTSFLLATAEAGYAPEFRACDKDSVTLRSAGLKGQSRFATNTPSLPRLALRFTPTFTTVVGQR